ncbi:MAG: hypothetical protein ACXVB9_18290 [Bdellovibrionota bacterium]
MKTNMKALLVMFTAFAVLPGCGKKSDAPVATGGPVSTVNAIGSGQCATVTANSAITLTFYGTLQQASGISGQLSAYGYGSSSFGGSNYYRNLSTGDAVNVYVSGSTAYAVLSMAATTATAIVQGQMSGYGAGYGYGAYNSGTAQVCGMYINESIFASAISGAGYTGTMGGGTIALWGNNSWITYAGSSQAILF